MAVRCEKRTHASKTLDTIATRTTSLLNEIMASPFRAEALPLRSLRTVRRRWPAKGAATGETAKILTTYTKDKIAEAIKTERQSWKGDTDFVKQVTDVWEETKKLYPEAANPQSKLYLRANEILFERGLAEVSENGTVQLLTPFAYRIAVEAASAELGRQAPANAETKNKKGRAVQVAGKGSIIRTGGKLSYAEYMKLDDDAKDAYDKSTTGG